MLTKCPICQNVYHKVLDFGGYKHQGQFHDLIKCLKCDFMFLHPKPSQDLLKKLYNNSEYFTKDCSGGGEVAYEDSFKQNKKRYQEIISRLKKYKKGGLLLEVGCAGGHFLELAKDFGYKVEGIEISSNIAELAKEKLGLNIIVGTIEDIKLPSQKYDIVYLGDVLEHIYNLDSFLKEIFRILKPFGLLYIDLPGTYNYTLLGIITYPLVMLKYIFKWELPFSKKYFLLKQHRKKYSDNCPYHLYEFTPKSVENLLIKYNFLPIEIISFDGWPKQKNYKTVKSKIFCYLKKISYFTTRILNFVKIGDRIIVLATKRKNII